MGNQFSHTPSSASNLPPVAPATAVLGSVGAATAVNPAAGYYSEPIDIDHKLNRGDRLSYRVVEDRDPTVVPLIVTDSGEVNVPLINRVKASGKTTAQLTADIKAKLEQEYYYHATVVLGLDAVAPRSFTGFVYMSGAIAGGSIPMPADGQLTLSQAIAQQGGFREFSDSKRVRVIRKGGPPKGYVINVKAVQSGDLSKDFVLQAGDQVIVPEKTFNISL